MSEATGERFIPELMPDELIAAEHHARYRLAAQLAPGRRVLDAGCGVGWGTELLVRAGAESATGVDIAWEVARDARRREPRAQFAAGDLSDLPFPASSFDLVTCFEAIEHVAKPLVALDELARVIRPTGMLLVSSPNPRVYPPGNPFHVHEFTPEELLEEVAARFPSAMLWRQFTFIASALVEGQAWSPGETVSIAARSVVSDPNDHDPYSVVVATKKAPLPLLTGVAMFAPSSQLTNLEREQLALREQWQLIEENHARLLSEAEAIHSQLGRARADREHAAARLLEAEQRVAVLIREVALEAAARSQAQEMLDSLHGSAIWRLTAPERSARRTLRRILRAALRRR